MTESVVAPAKRALRFRRQPELPATRAGALPARRPTPWLARSGALLLGALALLALLAPVLAPADPLVQDLRNIYAPPFESWRHPLGTDELGRDLASRLLYGGRSILAIAAVAVALSALFGIVAGLAAGYLGGAVDTLFSRIAEIQLAIPGLVLALLVLALLGTSEVNLVLILAIDGWPVHFRICRAYAQSQRRQGYVEAALLARAPRHHVVRRHLVPGVAPLVSTTVSLNLASTVLTASAMGFLGFGVQPPNPDWGAMVAKGTTQLDDAWWVAVFPGVCLVVLLLAIQFLGDHLSSRTSLAEVQAR